MQEMSDYRTIGEFGVAKPVARVLLSNPDPQALTDPLEIDAVLDTGSEITALLDEQVAMLRLSPVSAARVVLTAGGQIKVPKYVVEIEFLGKTRKTIFVVGIRGPFATIGRDLLDSFSLCFDGPRQTWSIEETENQP